MKYLYVVLCCWVTSCAVHDEQYYIQHPKALQQAVMVCNEKQNNKQNCEQLETLEQTMQSLALELRANQQAFGKRILALQEEIAKQKLDLKAHSKQTAILEKMQGNLHELALLLAVVKWLESPGA